MTGCIRSAQQQTYDAKKLLYAKSVLAIKFFKAHCHKTYTAQKRTTLAKASFQTRPDFKMSPRGKIPCSVSSVSTEHCAQVAYTLNLYYIGPIDDKVILLSISINREKYFFYSAQTTSFPSLLQYAN